MDDGLILWGAAHRGPANTPGFLDGFKVDREGVHLALFHGSERGWFSDQETGKQLHAPFDAGQIKGWLTARAVTQSLCSAWGRGR